MITLPYPPSVNRYWRNFRGRMVISAEGREFKIAAGWLCKSVYHKPMDGDVQLTMTLHPKLTTTGKASKTVMDLDNSLKCVCDCMNGIAYVDDSQIVRIVAEIGQAIKGGGVSVEVNQIVRA